MEPYIDMVCIAVMFWYPRCTCNLHPSNSNVPAGAVYLQVEVVNEDPEKPGVIGGSRISLYAVFNERSTEEWISIVDSHGEPVGQLLLKLEFDVCSYID